MPATETGKMQSSRITPVAIEEEVQAGDSTPTCSKPGQPVALRFEK